MKTILTFIIASILAILALISCNPSLKGEGNISDKDSILTPFKNIHIHGNCNVFFVNDSVFSVKIEANQNLLSNITIKNEEGTLQLKEDKMVSEFDIYKVTISGKNIQEIVLNDNVSFEIQGQISQEKMVVKMKDNTKFSGNIAVSDLNVIQSENSNSNFSGSVANADLELDDNASFLSPLFAISEANIELNDNSQVKITAIKSLEGTGTGNSKLIYTGEPNKNYTTKEQAICEKK